MSADKPRRLGRGLEALLSTSGTGAGSTRTEGNEGTTVQRIPIAQIRPNPFQPRREFRAEELSELEVSLRANGLLQPITVRPAPTGSGWELIAGERRMRAATRLGWTDIPAVSRDVDDRTLLTLALVENLQRADLNAIEEAAGYQRLIAEFGATQQEVADVVGKDRSTVANSLRLLQLPAQIKAMLEDGRLTAGHGRALLAVPDEQEMLDLAREAAAAGLSVRETERRVRETPGHAASSRSGTNEPTVQSPPGSPTLRRLEDQLRSRLQTDVQITLTAKDKGTLRLAFYSADDLERLLDLILGPSREPL